LIITPVAEITTILICVYLPTETFDEARSSDTFVRLRRSIVPFLMDSVCHPLSFPASALWILTSEKVTLTYFQSVGASLTKIDTVPDCAPRKEYAPAVARTRTVTTIVASSQHQMLGALIHLSLAEAVYLTQQRVHGLPPFWPALFTINRFRRY
jgi:hypothetical protein